MRFKDPISISSLLKMITQKVEVRGEVDFTVTGINELHSVEKGDLSFVDHEKYYERY